MARFAADTGVPVENTRLEIERTLVKYGAVSFLSGYHQNSSFVQFIMSNRQVRLYLKTPQLSEFTKTEKGYARGRDAQEVARDQALRQRWRALLLVIKAKLEAVESGISSFEEEFLPHILLPDGTTVAQWMIPQVTEAYKTGQMPQMLPGLPPHTEE